MKLPVTIIGARDVEVSKNGAVISYRDQRHMREWKIREEKKRETG